MLQIENELSSSFAAAGRAENSFRRRVRASLAAEKVAALKGHDFADCGKSRRFERARLVGQGFSPDSGVSTFAWTIVR